MNDIQFTFLHFVNNYLKQYRRLHQNFKSYITFNRELEKIIYFWALLCMFILIATNNDCFVLMYLLLWQKSILLLAMNSLCLHCFTLIDTVLSLAELWVCMISVWRKMVWIRVKQYEGEQYFIWEQHYEYKAKKVCTFLSELATFSDLFCNFFKNMSFASSVCDLETMFFFRLWLILIFYIG